MSLSIVSPTLFTLNVVKKTMENASGLVKNNPLKEQKAQQQPLCKLSHYTVLLCGQLQFTHTHTHTFIRFPIYCDIFFQSGTLPTNMYFFNFHNKGNVSITKTTVFSQSRFSRNFFT